VGFTGCCAWALFESDYRLPCCGVAAVNAGAETESVFGGQFKDDPEGLKLKHDRKVHHNACYSVVIATEWASHVCCVMHPPLMTVTRCHNSNVLLAV
jgi:hypothetical protein